MNSIMAGIHSAGQASADRHQLNPELRDTVSVTGVSNDIRRVTVRSALIHGSQCCTVTFPPVYYVHWRIYFQLNIPHPHHDSVEFNSQKLLADGSTRLYISYREYECSNKQQAVGRIEIPMIRVVTVQQLIDLILGRNRRDQYRLTDGGSGCRFWCKTVTADLEQAGWIGQGSGAQLESYFLSLHHKYGNGFIPYPLYQGTFY